VQQKKTPRSMVKRVERTKIRMSKNQRKRRNMMRVTRILLKEMSIIRSLKR